MSGSGGFYKYRCKYFLTHNCPNWVYANGHACSMCLAEGREALDSSTATTTSSSTNPSSSNNPWHPSPHQHSPMISEICVPQAFHGTLRYTIMEVIPASPADDPSSSKDSSGGGGGGGKAYWVLRQKAMEQSRGLFGGMLNLGAMTTSDTPRPVVSMAAVGVGAGRLGMGY